MTEDETFAVPAVVREALVARPSCSHWARDTRPRSSSRRTTWLRRGRVALVSAASRVIRSVWSGASESMASTWYSNIVRLLSRRSCASRAAGRSSMTATVRTHEAS